MNLEHLLTDEEKAIRGKLYSRCMHRLGYRLAKPE